MKVLITGSAGFIGSYLVPALLRRGDTVVGFDLAPCPESYGPDDPGLSWIRGDLTSAADLYHAVAKSRPDAVIHLASLLAGPCEDNPVRGFAVNFQSTLYLLDACVAIGATRFVLASSISVFGKDVPEPVANDALRNPSTVYGKTKLAGEQIVEWYRRKHGMKATCLRFPWVYGPGRENGITALYSSKLLDAVARNQPVHVENPDEKGDWLYVRDTIRAILLALDAPHLEREAYNIMGGVHSIRDVLSIAQSVVPEASISYGTDHATASPYPSSYDDSTAREELGWCPEYPIERAVREHIEIVAAG